MPKSLIRGLMIAAKPHAVARKSRRKCDGIKLIPVEYPAIFVYLIATGGNEAIR